MGKISPGERWRKHVLERFTALQQSGEIERLRVEGLAILDRSELLSPEEWTQTFHQRWNSPEYRGWHDKCSKVGERFGLAPWAVTMECLLKGYRPEEQPYVIENEWPQVRVITSSTDPDFLAKLSYEAQRLDLYVVQRSDSFETTFIHMTGEPEPPALESKPPRDNTFHMRVETPVVYPPEGAAELQRQAAQLGRELLRRLGYPASQRLRGSSLVRLAKDMRIGEGPLPRRAVYDIVDDIHGEDENALNADQQRRQQVKTGRHRLRKRLVDPHKPA
ncbi:MAG: hypothetical protein HY671_08220 [Chloroflexi bacterium]|nr:hypothetical protein [Chloroflexota bacterium]